MINGQSVTVKMTSLLEGFEKVSDHRAIFLNCYLLMTQNMLKAVETREFQDPDWVFTFILHFADYYFEALTIYEEHDPAVPAVWRIAHQAADSPKTQVMQNLLLGINAHINYDLVLALVDLLEPGWNHLPAAACDQRRSDFYKVNEIIRNTIDAVQDEVVERYSPRMDLVDKMFGPFDEWVISRLISGWPRS